MSTVKNYYDFPTQVRFYDEVGEHYLGGIAYQDVVICGCCGGAIEISEIIENTPKQFIPIRDLDWEDISSVISPDEEPSDEDVNYEQMCLFDAEGNYVGDIDEDGADCSD